jgi:hypothetical protein
MMPHTFARRPGESPRAAADRLVAWLDEIAAAREADALAAGYRDGLDLSADVDRLRAMRGEYLADLRGAVVRLLRDGDNSGFALIAATLAAPPWPARPGTIH